MPGQIGQGARSKTGKVGGAASLMVIFCCHLGQRLAAARRDGEVPPQFDLKVLDCSLTNLTCYLEEISEDDHKRSSERRMHLWTGKPSDDSKVQTNHSMLVAKVRLTNKGERGFGHWSTSKVPEYLLRVQRGGVWYLDQGVHFSGGLAMIEAGGSLDFLIRLPHDATSWRLDFWGQNACVKEELAEKLMRTGIPRYIRCQLLGTFFTMLPHGCTTGHEIKCGLFKTQGATSKNQDDIKPAADKPRTAGRPKVIMIHD